MAACLEYTVSWVCGPEYAQWPCAHVDCEVCKPEAPQPVLRNRDAMTWGACPQTGLSLAHAGGIGARMREAYVCDLR